MKKNHSLTLENPLKINFDFEPLMRTVVPFKVAYVRSFGNYDSETIGKAWDTLFQFATKNNMLTKNTQLFGISYDNPEISGENAYQYNACISIKEDIKPIDEVGIKELDGGRYAVFTYKGDYKNFSTIYDLVFKEWLLKSTYELRDSEVFDKYITTPNDTDSRNWITEIHIPIK